MQGGFVRVTCLDDMRLGACAASDLGSEDEDDEYQDLDEEEQSSQPAEIRPASFQSEGASQRNTHNVKADAGANRQQEAAVEDSKTQKAGSQHSMRGRPRQKARQTEGRENEL